MCSAFGHCSDELCHPLAMVARRLCTDVVDPSSLCTFLSCTLIALNKNPGVIQCFADTDWSYKTNQCLLMILLMILRQDIIDSVGPCQLCAGLCAGNEIAVHSVRSLWLSESSASALLVNASNAFTALNRATTLHNIQHLCPPLDNLVINCYRSPSSLFVGGSTLISEESTTQDDSFSMSLYMATIPLLHRVSLDEGTNQVWYVENLAAVGHLIGLRKWFDSLVFWVHLMDIMSMKRRHGL